MVRISLFLVITLLCANFSIADSVKITLKESDDFHAALIEVMSSNYFLVSEVADEYISQSSPLKERWKILKAEYLALNGEIENAKSLIAQTGLIEDPNLVERQINGRLLFTSGIINVFENNCLEGVKLLEEFNRFSDKRFNLFEFINRWNCYIETGSFSKAEQIFNLYLPDMKRLATNDAKKSTVFKMIYTTVSFTLKNNDVTKGLSYLQELKLMFGDDKLYLDGSEFSIEDLCIKISSDDDFQILENSQQWDCLAFFSGQKISEESIGSE